MQGNKDMAKKGGNPRNFKQKGAGKFAGPRISGRDVRTKPYDAYMAAFAVIFAAAFTSSYMGAMAGSLPRSSSPSGR